MESMSGRWLCAGPCKRLKVIGRHQPHLVNKKFVCSMCAKKLLKKVLKLNK